MTEKKMYEVMKKELHRDDWIFFQRIESNIDFGIPDLYYCIDIENAGWIELKQIPKYPKNGLVKIPFRTGQYSWLKHHTSFSDNTFLFLWIEDNFYIFRGKRILEQYSIDGLSLFSIVDASWKEVNWLSVFYLLLSSTKE